MNHDEHLERTKAEIAGARAEPLLLPPANPAYSVEAPYDEQNMDGYTIAEAHAALEAFKRNRQHQA